MKKRKLKRSKLGRFILFLAIIFIVSGLVVVNFDYLKSLVFNEINYTEGYISSDLNKVTIYDKDFNKVEEVIRGKKIKFYSKKTYQDEAEKTYYRIKLGHDYGYVLLDNVVTKKEDIIKETKIYVRTGINLLSEIDDGEILTLTKKGDELEVVGYDQLDKDGKVYNYKVKQNEETGYINSKYIVFSHDEALLNYDQEGIYKTHAKRGDTYGGGNAANLDYYPVDKPKFKDNVMPEKVYALYLNSGKDVIGNVDSYIEYAKTTKINSFVVDIKDNHQPGYKSPVMQELSPTNYKYAPNTLEKYQAAIKKIKDAGFYVIGRITVFKDGYYVEDHKEYAILNKNTKAPLKHQGTYWPSPYQREVWEFNIKLAKESVKEMGFNEIQFDYVRFPDGTRSYERAGTIDYRNVYNEDKAQAIQRFLMYACDELHKLNVYVSADVFGESAYTYVTQYGQYWAAISNVVDVISGMPYPDHFNKYEFGFTVPVWTVPYQLLNLWGESYVMKRQSEIPTPAIVRTWIQTYDSIKEPYITYDAKKVEEQITGLFDAGLDGGYMTWNSGSNISKYKSQKVAYNKEYD